MTKEDIIRMAQEADDYADLKLGKGEFHPDWHEVRDEHFAALVASVERKAIVEAMNKLMIEVDQIPRTATTKFASATVRVVGKEFLDLIQAREQS